MLQFATQLSVVILSPVSVAKALDGVYEELDAAYDVSYRETEGNRHEHELLCTWSMGTNYRDEAVSVALLSIVGVDFFRRQGRDQMYEAVRSKPDRGCEDGKAPDRWTACPALVAGVDALLCANTDTL